MGLCKILRLYFWASLQIYIYLTTRITEPNSRVSKSTKPNPWSRVVPDNPTVPHLIIKFPLFYDNRIFITALTRDRHLVRDPAKCFVPWYVITWGIISNFALNTNEKTTPCPLYANVYRIYLHLPCTSGGLSPACNLRICYAAWKDQLISVWKSKTKEIFSQMIHGIPQMSSR